VGAGIDLVSQPKLICGSPSVVAELNCIRVRNAHWASRCFALAAALICSCSQDTGEKRLLVTLTGGSERYWREYSDEPKRGQRGYYLVRFDTSGRYDRWHVGVDSVLRRVRGPRDVRIDPRWYTVSDSSIYLYGLHTHVRLVGQDSLILTRVYLDLPRTDTLVLQKEMSVRRDL
jgi:hypothetical protein